jgi:ABC-type Fe3+-siderophore transport system permease subunit
MDRALADPFVTRMIVSLATVGVVIAVLIHLKLPRVAITVSATASVILVTAVVFLIAQFKVEMDNTAHLSPHTPKKKQ